MISPSLILSLLIYFHIDLLRDFPKSRKEVFRQASLDIPPVLRGDVWAIVLDVDDNTCGSIYDSYDKESEGFFSFFFFFFSFKLDTSKISQFTPLPLQAQPTTKLTLISLVVINIMSYYTLQKDIES